MNGRALDTVEVYNINRDNWSQCKGLKIARYQHSSCILGDKLYVSGGSPPYAAARIEVASCSNLIDGSGEFTVLRLKENQMPDYSFDVFSPISSHEILIMKEYDVFIFYT